MAKHEFKVGMLVRATHKIIEADYHKGDRELADEGDEGVVTRIYRRYDGRQGLNVKFTKYRWSSEVICDDWDVEPVPGALDNIVAEIFSPESDS